MSNARSPRDVCSTTIGIRGISVLLAAGGPQLLRLLRLFLFLLRGPELVASLCPLRRDRLHLRDDAVDRLLQPELRTDALGPAALEELVDVLVGLALAAELFANLLVGHLELEFVGDGFEE